MNIQQTVHLRPAVVEDARALAQLIDIAGEGIPTWLWSRACGSGPDPLDVGEARARREEGGFSYRNAIVAENGGRPVGMVLSYAIDATEPVEDLPAPIVPFAMLEARSLGTWYVNALAVRPGDRRQGIGAQLLAAAESLARARGFTRTSIQVFSQNDGACRLYQRLGYRVAARSPVLLHPCQPYYDEDVLLLVRNLDASEREVEDAHTWKGSKR